MRHFFTNPGRAWRTPARKPSAPRSGSAAPPAVSDIEVGRCAVRTFFIDRRRRALLPIADHADLFGCSDDAVAAMWQGGTCVARCSAGHPHEAPADDCTCGIYGATSLQSLRWQYRDPTATIVAVIAAEGPTFIGSAGLRTAAARVVAYWCYPGPKLDDARAVFAEQCPAARAFTDLHHMLDAYDIPATSWYRSDLMERNIAHRVSLGHVSTTAAKKLWKEN